MSRVASSATRTASLTLPRALRRRASLASAPTVGARSETRKASWLYFDSVFPIQIGPWDVRTFLARFERESLLDRIRRLMPETEASRYGFQIEEVKPRSRRIRDKDGGAFVKFSYDAAPATAPPPAPTESPADEVPPESQQAPQDAAAIDVERIVQEHLAQATEPYKPWYVLGPSRSFVVRGRPWLEDMNRWPNSMIRIEFENGDALPQEQLYDLLRPYGRIRDILPGAKSTDGGKATDVSFSRVRSAAAARNCLHGATFGPEGGKRVTLRILYGERKHANMLREWLSSHPRVVLPILVLLLGSLSLVIFDPIRAWAIKTKVEGTFDLKSFRLYRWLKTEAIGRLGFRSSQKDGAPETGIEQERAAAVAGLRNWLADAPDTFIEIQGPRGSGKEGLLREVTEGRPNVLVIDCAEILRSARSDDKLAAALASQLGYWPQFAWLGSLNQLIDLASVGLIGTKTGFSSPLPDQLKAILNTAAAALKEVATQISTERQRLFAEAESRRSVAHVRTAWEQQVERDGSVRDGRLDALAGNGAMSELGAGIEREQMDDLVIVGPKSANMMRHFSGENGKADTATGNPLPLVIIKSFDTREGAGRAVLWDALAEWAATLVENRIAHVVFTSDSIVVSKSLTKALPSKPISQLALTDASEENAQGFVFAKLAEFARIRSDSNDDDDAAAAKVEAARPDAAARAAVSRLGGRQADLEVLVSKVGSGQTVIEAVDDIIVRSATEIRKNAFADGDAEEAKQLAWTPAQAWALVQQLATKDEVPYADLLMGPFKGADAPLRALEQAELVSVVHRDGRPSVIRPGKPVYRHAFQTLVADPVFKATQELALNAAATATAAAELKAAEDELVKLASLFNAQSKFTIGGGSSIPLGIARRTEVLLETLNARQSTLDKLAAEAAALKATLKSSV